MILTTHTLGQQDPSWKKSMICRIFCKSQHRISDKHSQLQNQIIKI